MNRNLSHKTQMFAGNTAYYLFFIVMTIIVFVPILLVIFGSFKTAKEMAETSSFAFPVNWLYFENYITAYKEGNILRGFMNTSILVTGSIVGNAILGTMTAYVLNRFQFKLRNAIFLLFMLAMIIPSYTTEIARFQLIHGIGAYNSLMGPLLIYVGTDIMQIYIYTQFLKKISTQLDESAMLDGASYARTFISIIFPLLLPATATLGILKSVTIMNDIYVQTLYMPKRELATLSTALMAFVGERTSDLGALCAGIILVLLPSAVIYLLFQRMIFKGLMDGAIKG